MKHFSYLNTAAGILSNYDGSQPFHLFTKDFFRQDKKYGSRDRKQITHLCYCYFRLGKSAAGKPLQQATGEALFLCSDTPNELLQAINPQWNAYAIKPVTEKCALLQIAPSSLLIFPLAAQLSDGIAAGEFNLSHLVQPNVFIRIRPGYESSVPAALQKAGITFQQLNPNCISLPSATKIEAVLQLNKEAVIQDYNSQQTGVLMQEAAGRALTVWDCCAASGGKSILVKDILGNILLTVSDIRNTVLHNLKKRFSEAGINTYTLLQSDLTKPIDKKLHQSFDLVIADAPCTGSGTWGRTPERLSFFDNKEIEQYSQLQQKIVRTIIPAIKNGGYFLYITCSVFKRENEDMVDFILQDNTMQLLEMKVLKGYSMKADTMFAALFTKLC